MKTAIVRAGLAVPADAIRMTSAFLQSMTGVESCCFWLGPREPGGKATVMAIVVPRQRNQPGNYHVEADAMVGVANVARPRGWTNLAQIHSHPGPDVRHSGYDDEMANSRRALSLVYPTYGALPGMWRFRGWLWRLWPVPIPQEIGVHAFLRAKWTLLDAAGVAAAMQVISSPKPAFIDLRT